MRTALLASLALTATLTSAFAPSIAEACGGYVDRGPQVFAVDSHQVLTQGSERWATRSFVLLGQTRSPEQPVDFQLLAPGTYDYTQIAAMPQFTEPQTMTLVGPSGTKVVSSGHRAILSQSWRSQSEQFALEVAADDHRVALHGSIANAKWVATTEIPTVTKDTAWGKSMVGWAQGQGLDTTYLFMSRIKGTKVVIVTGQMKDQVEPTSFIRNGTTALGAYTGSPIGALDLSGKRYVLIERSGLITPVEV